VQAWHLLVQCMREVLLFAVCNRQWGVLHGFEAPPSIVSSLQL